MRTLLTLSLVLLAACPGDDPVDTDTGSDSTGDIDTSDSDTDTDTEDPDSDTEDPDSDTEDPDSDTEDPDSDTDSDSDDGPPFANSDPSEGMYQWIQNPAPSPNGCGLEMFQTGNSLNITLVDADSMTFRARVDAPAFDQPGESLCAYEEDGSFSCDTASVTYDFADFGMSGTSVKTVELSGAFVPRIRVINGSPHTFSPSYSLQATVVTAYTCTASAQDCATAAMQGFGVVQIPCESTFTEPATNLSDPSLP